MAINSVVIFLLHCYIINDIFNRDYRLNRCRSLKTGLLARKICKFSISPACNRKIPLNPPLQKGEEAGMPGLIEKLQKNGMNA